jgi:hypothetical protein
MTSFIPSTERIPGVYQRVQLQRQGGLAPLEQSILLIGYRLAASASDNDNTAIRITSRSQSQSLFGAGSMLDLMVREAFKSGRLALFDSVRGGPPNVYAMPIAGPVAASVAATQTLTLSGTATAAGILVAYIGPETFTVQVLSGETAAEVAAKLEAAIDLRAPEMMFTAGVASAVVTLTARHIGTVGNDLVSYIDTRDTPGITAVVAAGIAGTGDVDLTTPLSNSLSDDYNAIVVPQFDASTQALLAPHVVTAWGYERKRYRLVVAAQNGDVSDAQTAAAAVDDWRVMYAHAERTDGAGPPPFVFLSSSRSMPFEVAASAAARLFSQRQPNWNFNNATLSAYGRPKTIDRDTLNDTLDAGVAEIVEPERGGAPGSFVDPVTTAVTDQTGATSAADKTWAPVEIAKTVAFMLRQIQLELDRFSQAAADEQTRISVIAACFRVLRAAEQSKIVTNISNESVFAEYELVGAATHLVVTLNYAVITGLDIVAVNHNVTRAI